MGPCECDTCNGDEAKEGKNRGHFIYRNVSKPLVIKTRSCEAFVLYLCRPMTV